MPPPNRQWVFEAQTTWSQAANIGITPSIVVVGLMEKDSNHAKFFSVRDFECLDLCVGSHGSHRVSAHK